MSFFRFAMLALGCSAIVARAQDERALQILQRAQQAAGGVEALAAIHDMIITRDIKAVGGGMGGRQTVKLLLPGAMRQESSLPFGLVAVSLVDGAGSLDSPQGKSALVGPQLVQAQGELFRVRERLLLADRVPEWSLRFVESANDAGRTANVLEVSDAKADQKIRLWIDKETGQYFRATFAAVALIGAQQLDEYYSDFREVDGVQTPFRVDVRAGGRPLTQIRIEKVLHNTGLTKSEMR